MTPEQVIGVRQQMNLSYVVIVVIFTSHFLFSKRLDMHQATLNKVLCPRDSKDHVFLVAWGLSYHFMQCCLTTSLNALKHYTNTSRHLGATN